MHQKNNIFLSKKALMIQWCENCLAAESCRCEALYEFKICKHFIVVFLDVKLFKELNKELLTGNSLNKLWSLLFHSYLPIHHVVF